MDLLQLALIFLIVLLASFLSITGFQVFLILRDLKKTLDKLNLDTGADKVKVKKPKRPTLQPRRLFKKST